MKAWFAKEFMQEKISDGVARLSARHLSMIVSELNKKFEGEAKLLVNKEHQPLGFGKGEVIWSIKDVGIEYARESVVYTDCIGGQMVWQGKAHIIEATRVMKGRLTHNKEKPVIPDPHTLAIEVHARLENLAVKSVGDDNYLVIEEGEVKFIAYPRLAQSQKGGLSGLRIVPTSNVRFEKVRLSNIKANLFSSDLNMPVTIDSSDLIMQAGVGENSDENKIKGKISIFGQEHSVPADGQGLDPSYEKKDFEKKFLCREDLMGTISYDHVAFERKIASPTAMLSTFVAGVVAERLEDNTLCGMASPEALHNTIFSGVPGSYGYAQSEALKPCFINFTHHQTKSDCFGKAYVIHGSAQVISAQRKLSGLIISDQQTHGSAVAKYALDLRNKRNAIRPQAIIPASRLAADFSSNIRFHGLSVREICLDEGNKSHPLHCKNVAAENDLSFTVYKGQVDAQFKPILAKSLDVKDAQCGFCSIKSPSGQVNIAISGLEASIKKGENDIHIYAEGDFEVIRGQVGARENELVGAITINDVHVPFGGSNGSPGVLDPTYNRSDFLDSFLSCNKMELVPDDDYCRPEDGLAPNIARLLALSSGSLLKVASSKQVAGSFASPYAVANRQLKDEEKRLILPAQRFLELNLEDKNFLATATSIDAVGNRMKITGKVQRFHGEMTRDGLRINRPIKVVGYNVNPSSNRYVEALSTYWYDRQEIFIRPEKPDATAITLDAKVVDYAVHMYKPGVVSPDPYLLIKSGEFSLTAKPFMAMDARTQHDQKPSYSIPTPIVKFDHIVVQNAPVVLYGAGIVLPLWVKKATLRAFNGRYLGEGNYIEGDIALSAMPDQGSIPTDVGPNVSIARQNLNLTYDQNLFNQSYSTTKNLQAILPSD